MKVTITMAHVRIYKAVEGAVRNAAHGHPCWRLNETMARSIAKRATGTLTAAWPDVLAAHSVPSDSANGPPCNRAHWPPRRYARMARKGSAAAVPQRRSPLPSLWKQIANKTGAAKRNGQTEQAAALIEVLRIIASMQSKAISENSGDMAGRGK